MTFFFSMLKDWSTEGRVVVKQRDLVFMASEKLEVMARIEGLRVRNIREAIAGISYMYRSTLILECYGQKADVACELQRLWSSLFGSAQYVQLRPLQEKLASYGTQICVKSTDSSKSSYKLWQRLGRGHGVSKYFPYLHEKAIPKENAAFDFQTYWLVSYSTRDSR